MLNTSFRVNADFVFSRFSGPEGWVEKGVHSYVGPVPNQPSLEACLQLIRDVLIDEWDVTLVDDFERHDRPGQWYAKGSAPDAERAEDKLCDVWVSIYKVTREPA